MEEIYIIKQIELHALSIKIFNKTFLKISNKKHENTLHKIF